MLTKEFKDFAVKTRTVLEQNGVFVDTYQLLNIVDGLFVQPVAVDYQSHEGRVQAALDSPEVLRHMRESKKIYAIKELRAITSCGLKEAKDAVEDYRVMEHYNAPNGW